MSSGFNAFHWNHKNVTLNMSAQVLFFHSDIDNAFISANLYCMYCADMFKVTFLWFQWKALNPDCYIWVNIKQKTQNKSKQGKHKLMLTGMLPRLLQRLNLFLYPEVLQKLINLANSW